LSNFSDEHKNEIICLIVIQIPNSSVLFVNLKYFEEIVIVLVVTFHLVINLS
jgi:hypothetical protein